MKGFPNGHVRAGDPVPSYGWAAYGMFRGVPPKEYKLAQASLSRALTRLQKRGLMKWVSGTIGTYSAGPALTAEGERIARLLAYPTVKVVT